MKKLIIAIAATLLSASAMADVATLQNTSFETNTVGNGYAYGRDSVTPIAAEWALDGGGAISHNYSAWGGVSPSGNYFAILQNVASISQTFTSTSAATYSFSFDMARRNGYDGGQVIGVTVDGTDVGSFDALSTDWSNASTTSLILAAGSHTLTFSGLNPQNKNDTSAFIDNVSMNVSAVPEPETYGMLLAGLGLMGFIARRRKAA